MADKGNKGRFKPGDPRAGRPKGSANKATTAVRDAIARVLESNTENFSKWLASVAEGEQEPSAQDDAKDAKVTWIRRPDPGLALKLAMDMAEYHIPKLARTELSGEVGIRGTLIISDG
jgi:hypothetical protein